MGESGASSRTQCTNSASWAVGVGRVPKKPFLWHLSGRSPSLRGTETLSQHQGSCHSRRVSFLGGLWPCTAIQKVSSLLGNTGSEGQQQGRSPRATTQKGQAVGRMGAAAGRTSSHAVGVSRKHQVTGDQAMTGGLFPTSMLIHPHAQCTGQTTFTPAFTSPESPNVESALSFSEELRVLCPASQGRELQPRRLDHLSKVMQLQ